MSEQEYVSTDPNFGRPLRQTARQQADTRPGQYVREMLRNVPADLIETARNGVTGTYDLLSVLAKATGEVGSDVGNFARDVVGLEPHFGGHENLQALGRVPGAVASHYAQYLDPDFRAEHVREHPVGMALDMAPVSAALKGGAGAARAGVSAVKKAPGRAIDTVIGAVTKRPMAALRGAAGQGPVERGLEMWRKATATPADEAAVAARVAPPASSHATPAPAVAPSAPVSAPARPATPAPSPDRPSWLKPGEVLSPQRIQNELGIYARRQKVTLTEPQYQAAAELVAQGRTPAEAVTEIASRVPAAPPAAASATPAGTPAPAKPPKVTSRARMTPDEADEYLRLTGKGMTHEEAVEALMQQRQLAKKLKTPSPESARRRVAARNVTGKWPNEQ